VSSIDPDLRVDQFDFDLPGELIAQTPLERRDASRLMVVERSTGLISHRTIRDLPRFLRAGDLVVVNNTRVYAGRMAGKRASGGSVELLLLRREAESWLALAKPAKRLRVGERVALRASSGVSADVLGATIVRQLGDGLVEITLTSVVERELERVGSAPLPPYIHERLADPERYQTVFATMLGSAAAPTAGLHLTAELLRELDSAGMSIGYATLHVGLDTFRPVAVERVADHVIHREWCEVSPDLGAKIAETRRNGGRIIAVGTTTARTLETLGREASDTLEFGWSGWTDIFITPGYRWRAVDGLLTNFHLPRSTLLMMVSAFAGSDLIRMSYSVAIAERYRFFSFGDAQLIL